MSEQPSELRGALPAGTVLRGYVIEAVLGYGGYGVVYRARHEELGHLVAIKEYLPADLSVRDRGTVFPRSTDWQEVYEDGKRRFLEEAKRVVQFTAEPGVVTCLDFFRANGTAYLVMEHVDGLPLADLLKGREGSGRPLNEEELLSLVIPLLKTLSRLHEAGVLHRDVKPSNILVRRADGQPMLIDFGAAKEGVALHSKSVAPYTEGYAALEQIGEGELGPWTDIYGVGAVMWRIVAGGSPPWTPPNPSRVELRAAAVLTGKPDPLPLAVELGAGRFSRGLLEAVDRCMVIRADERIQSAEELSRWLAGQNEIRPESAPESLPEAPPGRSTNQVGRVVAKTFAALVLGAAVWIGMTGHLPWSPPKEVDVGPPATTVEDGPVDAPEPMPGSFRVETVPAAAVVALLNGGPRYEPGMRLEPGRYQIEVSAPGYATRRELVEHGTADTVRRIELREHESPAPTPERPPEPKRDTEPKSRPSRPSEWTNSVGMRFVRIPAGEFLMGSTSELAYDYERPVTRVQIRSAFWMGKYEVTQRQWRAVMGDNPSRFENCGPDCPVESVSWDDVQRFVRKLNVMEETARYRLPTEAEWEYAARAGTSTDTSAGNLQIHGERNAPLLDGIAWYGGNSGVDYAGAYDCLDWAEKQYSSSWCGPHPVGEKDPNAFGLHDMLGNVWEWVRDWHWEYPGGSLTDPTGSAEGSNRVFRGCDWGSYARSCRSSDRLWDDPDTRDANLGFRLRASAPGNATQRELVEHGTTDGIGPGSERGVGGGVARIGGAVSQPRVIYKVEPHYTQEARDAKLQGIVMLTLEVWEDGLAHNIRVINSLGLGLDEKAVEAVKQWRFSPGMKDGKPVKVLAQIQVSFRLL